MKVLMKNEIFTKSPISTIYVLQEAVGPCGSYPCQNNGRCLDTKSTKGHRMYICICPEGWTGQNCHKKGTEEALEWAAWEDWGTCSASCGHAYQKRVRKCLETSNGKSHPSTECYGRDVEYRACLFKECPSWDEWSAWGECSTYTTCGRGYKVRHRNCSNGGVAGVDRYCKGPSNDSAVCEGISCRGGNFKTRKQDLRMVRLVDGPSYGEGLVEVFDSANQQWLQVCGDTWSMSMADIVCKQTGFLAAYHAITDGRHDTNVNSVTNDGNYDTRYDLNSSDGISSDRNGTNSSLTSEFAGTVAPDKIVVTVKLDCPSINETTTIHQCARTVTNCSIKAGVQCKGQYLNNRHMDSLCIGKGKNVQAPPASRTGSMLILEAFQMKPSKAHIAVLHLPALYIR
ncbi:hypothetical protein KUTeg_016429 [Tegillarca granosa]|uniref:Uncharacterized protein n=1 Tax=Tegillarca granosa TaxID=220873 RepID=A0ABQ9EKU8_TEGGR|nr:hypothetical protein KUTeg_016429 [Tegillarca granosa]